MATFNTAVRTLIARRTFDQIFTPEINLSSNLNSTTVSDRTFPTRAFTVYSGTQPTAQTVEQNWLSYNSSNSICLAHYSGSVGITFQYNAPTLTYFFTNPTDTITSTALNSGNATWAIIWMTQSVDISLLAAPASSKFVVVPVTNTSDIGVIRYTSTTATQGQAFRPYDGGITVVEQ
jgi:hypothetical protein